MKSYTLIVSLFLFLACSKNNEHKLKFTPEEIALLELDSTQIIQVTENSAITINLNDFLKNNRTYNFGEMVKTIEIIPLETTNESLIAEIYNVAITDSYIYIHDDKQETVLIFDKKGNFVRQIQKGQGPGEITYLKYIAFDADNNELIVFHNHFFSFFTPDGQFKRREKIPLNAYSFAILPDGYFFHSVNSLNNKHIHPNIEHQILVTDKNYKLRSVGFPYSYAKDNNYEGLTRYMQLNENTINTTFKFTNSIYQYVDDFNMKLKYRLDISSKEVPNSLLQENYERLMSGLEENDYYFYMGDYAENKTHDFFRLMNLHTRTYTFVYRDKQSGNCMGGVHKVVDRSMFIALNEPISSYGQYFVSYAFPHDEYTNLLTATVFPDDVVKKLKALSEDDNPVLVLYELKNF